MTYGWAILIVIVVVAALYSMGVFNPSTPSENYNMCNNWCQNITTNEITQRESSVNGNDCVCKITIPIEDLI